MLGVLTLVGVVLFLFYTSYRHSQQTALRKTMIEKFGSAQDLATFLQSEGGRRFMEGLTQEGPMASILGSVQKGIVILLLGLGCAGASAPTGFMPAMGAGIVLMFVGVGFLISATVTYLLSRQFGLLGKRRDS